MRIDPKKWCKFKHNHYLISGNLSFEMTIGELLLGKSKSEDS